MKRYLSISISVLATAFLWGAPGLTLAQEDEDAFIHRGVELRRLGRNEEALAEFRHAYELNHSPRGRAQIALAEQALGQWVQAESDLLLALASGSDSWIVRNQETLLLALQTIREHLGTLEIESNVDGATISVNGSAIGRSPLASPLRVPAGATSIQVQASGYGPVERKIEIPAGGQVKAAIVVVPLPATSVATAPIAPIAPTAPTVNTADAGASRAAPVALADEQSRSEPGAAALSRDASVKPARTAAWVALAVSAALLATGVAAHVVREHNAGIYDDDARCFYGQLTRDERCGSKRSAADAAGIVAVSAYAAGGIALIVGTALLLAGRKDSAAERPIRVAAGLAPGAAQLSLATSF